MAALAKRRIQTHEQGTSLQSGQQHNAVLNCILNAMTDAVIYLDQQGHIVWANQKIESIADVSHGSLVGQTVEFLVPDQNLSEIPARTRCFDLKMLEEPGVYEDVACLHSNGDVWVAEVRVTQPSNGGERVVVLSDTTPKKKLADQVIEQNQKLKRVMTHLEKQNTELQATQQMLVQAGKMAALGELVSGIAHELNQPLTGIRGYAQELRSMSSHNDPATFQDFIAEIIKNADKMHQIINQLRGFARKNKEESDWYSVSDAVTEAVKLTKQTLHDHNIKLTLALPEVTESTPLRAFGNALQMEQVMINLLTNARDAIIETKRASGQVWISLEQKVPEQNGDGYFEIKVRDDGAGMTEATRAKIFNPFFTTKEVGKGMGLGLSLSFGMVEKIHGSIQVESTQGRGSEFVVRIPVDFRSVEFRNEGFGAAAVASSSHTPSSTPSNKEEA